MVDLTQKTIENIFFNQMKDISVRTYEKKYTENRFMPRSKFRIRDLIESFDLQFSDIWIEN